MKTQQGFFPLPKKTFWSYRSGFMLFTRQPPFPIQSAEWWEGGSLISFFVPSETVATDWIQDTKRHSDVR